MALLDDAEDEPDEVPETCIEGFGSLLSDRGDETHGRDVQLRCKVKTCPVCGPKKRQQKIDQIMNDFRGGPIHAVLADDEEWEAFHKTHVDRDGARYHRIPAPDGKSIILTDADVGEVIDEQDVAVAIELNPDDGRRMTHSREWKEVKPKPRWKRVGISPLDATERAQVYMEEGCNPKVASTDKALVGAHDVDLPPADSKAMERLKDRLRIRDEEKLGPDGWPVPAS